MTNTSNDEDKYFVYILQCSDGSYFTDHTTNVEESVLKHNRGKGSNSLRKRLPAKLVWLQECASHKESLRVKRKIKELKKNQKEDIIDEYSESLNDDS